MHMLKTKQCTLLLKRLYFVFNYMFIYFIVHIDVQAPSLYVYLFHSSHRRTGTICAIVQGETTQITQSHHTRAQQKALIG